MEKNYYEILEVDKHASSDIIKKAYTTLAKKYHPDLQPDDQKEDAKKKLQKINEAYETLSNEELRKEYDTSLSNTIIPIEQYNAIFLENQRLKNIINEFHKQYLRDNYEIIEPDNNSTSKDNSTNEKNYNNEYNKYYNQDNFSTNNISLEYKIKNIIAIILTFLILFLLWQIPFIRNFIYNFIFRI